MKPLGYYAAGLPGTTDADILDRISEQFGSHLQELTRDDQASLLVCLLEVAICPQQVLTEPNFFPHQNGSEAWQLVQQLSVNNQLALSVALANFIVYGGQS